MPLTCFPEPKLTKIAFKSREIKNLLAELDVYGGAGPDGIFPMLFVRMSDFLAPKISTIFQKLTRPGHFSICWRTGPGITNICLRKCTYAYFGAITYVMCKYMFFGKHKGHLRSTYAKK